MVEARTGIDIQSPFGYHRQDYLRSLDIASDRSYIRNVGSSGGGLLALAPEIPL